MRPLLLTKYKLKNVIEVTKNEILYVLLNFSGFLSKHFSFYESDT